MRGGAWVALVLCALLVIVPGASAASFLQAGADPGRTGNTGDAGPEHLDVAMIAQLRGERVPHVAPLIIDGDVHVLTRAFIPPTLGEERADLSVNAIWRLDPDNGAVIPLVEFDEPPAQFASDGQRFFVVTDAEIMAVPVEGGDQLWSVADPAGSVGASTEVTCASPAVTAGAIFVACSFLTGDDGPEPSFPIIGDEDTPVHPAGAGPIVMHALEPATGEVLWRWSSNDPTTQTDERRHRALMVPWKLAYGDGQVALVGQETTQLGRRGGGYENVVWWVNATTGTTVGSNSDYDDHPPLGGRSDGIGSFQSSVDLLYGDDQFVDVYDSVKGRDPASLDLLWTFEPPPPEPIDNRVPGAPYEGSALHELAFSNTTVYLARVGTIFAIDARPDLLGDSRLAWEVKSPDEAFTFDNGELLIAGERLFAPASDSRHDSTLMVFDMARGERAWQLALPDSYRHYNPVTVALGDGLYVATTWDGAVHIIGRTAISILPTAEVSNAYPRPGEQVELDLSATRSTPLSEDLEYRVNWGDGASTEWGSVAVLRHVYTQPGIREAQVEVRNAAGQHATEAFTFDVGGTPPQETNALRSALAPENQDMTFGVLGILVAAIGGLIAVARRRRDRTRLTRELEAIEAAYQGSKDRPIECEVTLAERKAHARGLLVDGKLDDSQFAVIDRRIDELGGQLRVETIDERFGFLSISMARTLRDMLADGQISDWERDHFLQALEEDAHLLDEQKVRIRDQIEAWFDQDRGAQA